jgi:putative sigma-54 modulation protein
MQITITARHFELTKAIRDHVETACLKLDKYFDQIITIHVILAWDNNRNMCEMSLHASKFGLQSESEEVDMYLAIDNTIDKMEVQIKKLKEKVTDHHKHPLKEYDDFSRASLYQTSGANNQKKLIKTKRVMTETLTVQEAIDQLSAMEDGYFIFKNVETDGINVLVRKDETHFKLFEP